MPLPPPQPPSSPRLSLWNRPRTVFIGWASLTVLTGLGYYIVKTRNTAKKKKFMLGPHPQL
ncbi:hypothetical protein OC834_001001 [Tilletia horrida]|uniref:Uncharacterized protein n=1 Tax=Tilletia horrida TaxID=155126 RepID=A0AAN6JHS5_9BASI|nr:hypothetical protein OC842_006322 [Tilletia horrida]KAK0536871.1 hypothetical protein OC834_001001 [Tilletia horrida]KAK0539111.1 hypothetical protein OC835_001246 [Tilletia horrida]KAK0559695.1 hypothetical protein OC844_004245 [Tilletia horrida]